jgi:hypothetical protein
MVANLTTGMLRENGVLAVLILQDMIGNSLKEAPSFSRKSYQ